MSLRTRRLENWPCSPLSMLTSSSVQPDGFWFRAGVSDSSGICGSCCCGGGMAGPGGSCAVAVGGGASAVPRLKVLQSERNA